MKNVMKHPFHLVVAAVGLAALLVAPGALAQGQGQGGGYAPPAASQGSVSDAQLENFVEAQSDINAIQAEYSKKIQSVQDQQEARTLQTEAQEKMVEAVDESGLSVEEYNQIAQQASADPELRERIQELIGS